MHKTAPMKTGAVLFLMLPGKII